MKNNINKLLFIIIYSFITVSFLYAAPINNFIDSVSPAMNSINSGTSDNIIIYFSQDMNIFTINNTGIKVTGNQTGYMSAVVTYDIILKTAVINTDQDFKTGEKIYVNVDSTVKTSGNIPVDAISYNFTAGATRGDGNFTVSNFSGNNLIPDNIFPGDYDNDGNVDLMIFDMDSHTASLFKNDGAGNFILSNTILLDTILVPTFTTGDYDNDGDLDIAYVIGVYGVFDLQVLLNNGDGTFIEGYFGPYNHDRIPDSGMMSCDFNNDGLIDILLFGNGRFFGSVFLLPNLGNGVFSVQGITLTQNICSQNYLIVYAYVNSYAAGDFNNDGNLDILIFSYMNWLNMNGDFEECYSIRSMVNDGNGSFSENAVYSITEGLTVYCTGDFNNDGYTDVLCNGKILLNDGTGLFSIVTSPINGGACAAADFDSDGDLDVAVSEGSGVMLYKNNGNAEFSEPVSFSTGSGPGAICSANFDGDCDIDIASVNSVNLSVLLNSSNTDYCSLTGPDLLETGQTSAQYTTSDLSGYWEILNTPPCNASIEGSNSESSVLVNAGNEVGQFVLYHHMQDDCGWKSCSKAVSVDNPLPVELESFTYLVNKNDVMLSWSTSVEINKSGFEVERSDVKGKTSDEWIKTGSISGKGNSNTLQNYFFEDKDLVSGKYKYRLKQTDYNGNFEYFNLTEEVVIGIPDKFSLGQNYPNPFNPVTKISYEIPYDSKVSLKIFDISGREIRTLVDEYKAAGYYTIDLNASGLASGIYFYRISAEGNGNSFTAVKKMMVLK